MSNGTNWHEIKARCPFFRRIDPQDLRINCEGFVSDSTIMVRFQRKSDLTRHFESWCCNKYEACELCRALWDGFTETDD